MTPEYSAKRARERHPIKRQSRPDELAFAVAFLCSDRAGAITGTCIHIDAGKECSVNEEFADGCLHVR